jgi:hypothetical protein
MIFFWLIFIFGIVKNHYKELRHHLVILSGQVKEHMKTKRYEGPDCKKC